MKKILITGADGFIGSHLVESLYADSKDEKSIFYGYELKALSQYNSFNYWGHLEELHCLKDIELVSGDVRDAHFCKKITKDVDYIFHLAALIAIPYSYIAPDAYVDVNVKGTLNICQAALENGIKRLIHTSTSEVYGTAKYVPIDENHPLQAQSPYSASKIAADCMALSFYNSFDLPLVVARPFNTYGPRQSARAFIPTIITQILNGVEKIKVGDLSPTRDFNFVKDTCLGFLELAKSKDAIGEVVNISSNFEISMKDTLELIKELMHANVEFIVDEARIRPKNSEVFRLFGDNSKIKNISNFKPRYSFKDGLLETIEWFKEAKNLNKYKHDIYNI